MPAWSLGLKRHVWEFRRRRVFRTAAAYLVVGWALVQVADATFEPLGFPAWSQRALIIAIAAGLLPVCVLSWIYDITRRGVVRTPPADPPGEAAPAAGATRAAADGDAVAAFSPIAAVAVLPFSDMSQARDQDWFCDGLAEEIIDSLCCVRGLRVASRTAAFRFRDGSVDPREIGRRLGVDAILEGSVRKSGDRLRVSAQLVDARDGYHLWSESYERRVEDVFAIQAEIAGHVAQALKLSVGGPAAARPQRYAPAKVEAYEFYLRGRQLAGQTTGSAWSQAPRMFRRAIEIDPGYPQALAGLADSLAQQILWRYERAEDVLAEASAAASKALDLAPDLAEAHVAQGHIRSLAGDHEGATRAFERAVSLNPELHEAWYYFARHCFARGEYPRAAELFQQAHRTRPDEYVALALAVNALDASGDRAGAEAAARAALPGLERQCEFEPENPRLHYMTGQVHLRLGNADAGRRHIETALRLRPDDFATLYNAACFFSLSGDTGRALDLLDQALALGTGYPDWIARDPDLAPLRELPRFKQVMARLG